MMRCASNCLDEEVAVRLLAEGVFLSTKVPPITKMQGLMLLAEAKLDSFVKEFKGLVREVLSGCQLSDFQATPTEIGGWFGEASGPATGRKEGLENECSQDNAGVLPHSGIRAEVVKDRYQSVAPFANEYLQNRAMDVRYWYQWKGGDKYGLAGSYRRE
jgi:hypothetical protein